MVTHDNVALHWLTLELLSRYAEALSAGLEVERMYPSVSSHLADCDECRETLNQLRDPPNSDNNNGTPESDFRVDADLSPEADGMQWALRPDSRPAAFGLQLAIRTEAGQAEDDAVTPTLSEARPAGGKLFINKKLLLVGEIELSLQAAIDPSASDQLSLTGYLTGTKVPDFLKAHLFVGQKVYHADMRNGHMQIDGVSLAVGINRIALLLESV